ncbi:MAG: helix-turn-helix transcriptional regulator, partial [Bacteroidota bacterium]|nr:helix-turn-helix transcriptional regulator [Bacteroidota bacterium]
PHIKKLNLMRTITAKVAIGLIIKAMREHRKMSQRHVRQETEIDVSHYETFDCCPTMETFLALCKFFRFSAEKCVKAIDLLVHSVISEDELPSYLDRSLIA